MNPEDQPSIPIGTLRGRGHTLPAKPVPDPFLSTTLPDGVVRARLGAVVQERVATAQTIIDLEKLVIDATNGVIRVRNILSEIRRYDPKLSILKAIDEALKEIG